MYAISVIFCSQRKCFLFNFFCPLFPTLSLLCVPLDDAAIFVTNLLPSDVWQFCFVVIPIAIFADLSCSQLNFQHDDIYNLQLLLSSA